MPVAAALACGLLAALFYLSVLTGSTGSLILVYLVQLPLFGAGLALGIKGALIASGAAALATAAAGGPASGGLFLLVEAAPVLLLVGLALRRFGTRGWYPSGRLAVWVVALGALPLAIGAVALSSRAEGLRGAVEGIIAGALHEVLAGAGAAGAHGREVEIAKGLAPWFPALAALSWLLMIVINGVLAQGALARFRLNRRPNPDIARLELPRWLAGFLALAAILAVLAPGGVGYLGRNLLPVIGFAYVLAGLAVLHAAARKLPGRIGLLVPAYLTLLMGWPALALAVCGFVDQWFGLRRRFAAALPLGEE